MKKLLSVAIIACSVILLAGCGSKKADVSDVTATGDITVPAVTTTNGQKSDATKAQCLEMVTFGMNMAIAQSK
jgi:PBP1b-binding outer membrane lipoprotein LpoB